MTNVQIVGRRSSLFTRVVLVFAEELAIEYEFVPIHDMLSLGPEAYADNPALKLPILRMDGSTLFGAQNICRALTERVSSNRLIVWPESLHDDLSRNAQELVWHCMAAQVQFVMGAVLGKLPPENAFFTKTVRGLEGSLHWLESNLCDTLTRLPPHDISLLEVSALCLVDHLAFRPTITLEPYPRLRAFVAQFASDPAAINTAYRFDT